MRFDVFRLSFLQYILLFLVIFSFLLIGHTPESADTFPNAFLPITLIREHNFDFNEFVSDVEHLPYWVNSVHGRVVSMYPIFSGILNVPVFLVAHLIGVDIEARVYFLSRVSTDVLCALSAVVMYGCFLEIFKRKRPALFFTFIYVFATLVWSVASRALWQHGASLFFISLALLLFLRKRDPELPYAGLCLGFAVVNRFPNLILAVPLLFHLWRYYRSVFFRSFIFFLLPFLPFFLYSHFYLGSIWKLGQGQTFTFFNGNPILSFAGLLISPSRGLFIFTPLFLFSFFYLGQTLFRREGVPLYRSFALGILGLIFFYSYWRMWWGGWTFGYRFLIELIPFLMIFLVESWRSFTSRHLFWRGVFSFFLVFSLVIQFLGTFYYPCGFDFFPNNIDENASRLWSLRNSELTRCVSNAFRLDMY